MLTIEPFIRPNLTKDCYEYSEQVGEYLQVEGSRGEIKFWYSFIKSKRG